jgi:hypothetical protein
MHTPIEGSTLVDLAGDVIVELFDFDSGDIRIPKVGVGCAESDY